MPAPRVEIRFPGTHEDFAQAFERLRDALDADGLSGEIRFRTELVFEELVANIVNHGALPGRALEVRVTLEPRPDSVVLTFEDDGVAFDPRNRPAPRPLRLDEERIGGFGLELVRQVSRSLEYERTPSGRNRVTVTLPRDCQPKTSPTPQA